MKEALDSFQNIYFIGIKGAGMSALAHVLVKQGKNISGSDLEKTFFTDKLLQDLDIDCKKGFKKENLPRNTDVCVYSTAYSEENPEVKEARSRNIPVLSYPEALGMLIKIFDESIAIAGTHGKSTITALLGWVMDQGGKDPTVIVGAHVNNWHGNARSGSKTLLVFEADEYQNKFRYYHPTTIVLNNINHDHPDYFPTFTHYRKVFETFINNLPKGGIIIANYDHLEVRHLAQKSEKQVIWYGENKLADWQLISRKVLSNGKQKIKVGHNYGIYGEFTLSLIGKHNALNTLPVIALAEKYGVRKPDLEKSLAGFQGTKRRLEFISNIHNILIIDDYAHHPKDIEASIEALKENYPDRNFICVFQPHTYSRTKAFLHEFARAFHPVDTLVLIDIYGSAREKKGSVSITDLANSIKEYNERIVTVPTTTVAHKWLYKNVKPGDLVVTMGAGDTWEVASTLSKSLVI